MSAALPLNKAVDLMDAVRETYPVLAPTLGRLWEAMAPAYRPPAE